MLVILAALLPAPRLQAAPSGADYVVTRTDDPAPGGCLPGDCSLREAVMASNTNPGIDTIRLKHGFTYVLSIAPSGVNSATSGDLNLSDSVNFDFSNTCLISINCGATIRGGAGWADRIFELRTNAVVQMHQLTIEYGAGVEQGGAFFVTHGTVLTLTNSIVMSNTAETAGGIYSQGSLSLLSDMVTHNQATKFLAGGVEADFASENLLIEHSTITANHAKGSGGGVVIHGGAVALSNTTLSYNYSVTGDGGGLFLDGSGSPVQLANMTIVSNTSGSGNTNGGGIADNTGELEIRTSTLAWNHAECGGGLSAFSFATVQVSDSTIAHNLADTFGGGACEILPSTVITLTNVTVSDNNSLVNGGGLALTDSGLYNSTLSGNTADSDGTGDGDGGGLYVTGQVFMANTILAGNVDLGAQAPECNGPGVLALQGNNLIQGPSACATTGTTVGDKLGVDPQLGPLADNGGPTQTRALPGASPAVNAGNPAGCRDWAGRPISNDQRGLRRWDRCDMGAFERQPLGLLFLPLARR